MRPHSQLASDLLNRSSSVPGNLCEYAPCLWRYFKSHQDSLFKGDSIRSYNSYENKCSGMCHASIMIEPAVPRSSRQAYKVGFCFALLATSSQSDYLLRPQGLVSPVSRQTAKASKSMSETALHCASTPLMDVLRLCFELHARSDLLQIYNRNSVRMLLTDRFAIVMHQRVNLDISNPS